MGLSIKSTKTLQSIINHQPSIINHQPFLTLFEIILFLFLFAWNKVAFRTVSPPQRIKIQDHARNMSSSSSSSRGLCHFSPSAKDALLIAFQREEEEEEEGEEGEKEERSLFRTLPLMFRKKLTLLRLVR